ncbi:multidrug ABC transporter ATP-binding protein, partial [Streptomyces nanshensis]
PRRTVRVRGPEPGGLRLLADRLAAEGAEVDWTGPDALAVGGTSVEDVGDLAHRAHVRLHELRAEEASLEEAYLRLTSDSVEYAQPGAAGPERAATGEAEVVR